MRKKLMTAVAFILVSALIGCTSGSTDPTQPDHFAAGEDSTEMELTMLTNEITDLERVFLLSGMTGRMVLMSS